jgi:RNA polymerase sigma-70 factor (ECF subfamily)
MTSPRRSPPAGSALRDRNRPPEGAGRTSVVAPPGAEEEATDRPAPARGRAPAPSAPPLTAEVVFREHAGRVYGVALRVVGNEADAEDVTQEVLLQVVRKLDTFRGEAALTTWLHRVTVNAALALRRRQAPRHEPRPGAAPGRPWQAAPDEQALGRELRGLIEAAVESLPEPYRAVYVLADVEGLSNAAAGAALGLSLPPSRAACTAPAS